MFTLEKNENFRAFHKNCIIDGFTTYISIELSNSDDDLSTGSNNTRQRVNVKRQSSSSSFHINSL
ncbi:hypothetical protein DERF_014593 [Dermatophagoides farinae]|uniref:Uncharacterized protein n=1 Tax=Dermatophagoides farinae TaxID=6954 RepID=A0A922HPG0_DERFA|nr:hypothetical protein DERF_014593 [Dermatophagoides farinae]